MTKPKAYILAKAKWLKRYNPGMTDSEALKRAKVQHDNSESVKARLENNGHVK